MAPSQGAGRCSAQGNAETNIPGLTQALLWQAWPNVGSQVLAYAISTITVVWVSRLDDPVLLGAVGLGTMMQNVFGFSLGYGLTAGLNTRLSHSFGRQRPDLMRLDLQRAHMLGIGVSIPCMFGLSFSESFFLLVGINAKTAVEAARYVRGTLLCMPLYMHFWGTCMLLRNSRLPKPDYYVRVLAAILHPLWLFLFLDRDALGSLGAGLAYSASTGMSFLLLTAYVLWKRPGPVKDGAWLLWPSFKELRAARDDGFWGYLKVAMASALLIWTEWWVYEIMFLLAGLLGTEALATHTAVSQTAVILFMIPSGLQMATNTLVGNARGQGQVHTAKTVLGIACAVAAMLFLVIGLLLYIFSDALALFFTSDPQVLKTFDAVLAILPLFLFLDAIQTVLEGGLTGLHLQNKASVAKVISMIFVRLGGGWLLAFPLKLGLPGIWLGGLAGMAVTLALYVLILCRADYELLFCTERQPLIDT